MSDIPLSSRLKVIYPSEVSILSADVFSERARKDAELIVNKGFNSESWRQCLSQLLKCDRI